MLNVIEREHSPADDVREPPPEPGNLPHGAQRRRITALLVRGDDGVDGERVVEVEEEAAAGVWVSEGGGVRPL